MSLAIQELARRDDATGRIDFRSEAARLRVSIGGMESRDGHDVSATFELGICVAEGHSDRELFREAFLHDRATATREDITAHLGKRTRDSVRSIVDNSAAADILAAASRQPLIDAFRAAAEAAAFACGLMLVPPIDVELQSASLQRHRLEQMQRQRTEERAAGQVEHLRRAGELLKQFQSIRASADSIGPGDVLRQISPADRGSTLEALLLASSQQDQQSTLYAVSGPSLVRIERAALASGGILSNLPRALGPLRSVQRAMRDGKPLLLVGARDGVLVVYPDSLGEPLIYPAPATHESQLGFNGVVFDEVNDCIYGTHGDRGVVRWSYQSREPIPAISTSDPVQSARFPLLVSPGVLAFVHGETFAVVLQNGSIQRTEIEGRGDIVGVTSDAARLFVIHRDGAIVTLDRATREVVDVQQRTGNIVAAAALPWLGSIRLLLARDDGPIECVGPDDQLVTQYSSVQRGYKMISASADVVAAVSSDRQRVILWHAWDGRRPFAEVHLTSQTRHRVADIEFT